MQTRLKELLDIAKAKISEVGDLHELQNLKSHYLGKKSELNSFMQQMGKLPAEERPAFGKVINEAKNELEEFVKARESEIKEAEYINTLKASKVDLTMPGRVFNIGTLHPITQTWREIEDIFMSMGFDVAEGYDVEDDFHNFDALNTPKDHPARKLSDTFYVEEGVLLRTQTSTVQVRVMENHKPPIRIISPGRCYRNDKPDASHSPAFHQVEALVVDEGITFATLKDTLNIFVEKLFGKGIKSRFRPHFFPYTEPSAEMDILCVNCRGKGCNVCKGSGWLELGGAGMVDPYVFDILGIDSEKYTGFAFGFGIDRIAMTKHNVPDLRILYDNDLRFLSQFVK